MKRIDNRFLDFADYSIMATANLCVENQKHLKRYSPRRTKAMIAIFIFTTILAIFGNPILAFANFASLMTLLASANTFKMSARSALKSMCNHMALMANGHKGRMQTYYDDVEVEIVPKNIQVGEDLESLNIVPIFKEGKYVIIKSYDYPCFIQVFENEGKEEVYALEPTDEDIEILERDLPEYQEYIDVFKLQKTPTNLF